MLARCPSLLHREWARLGSAGHAWRSLCEKLLAADNSGATLDEMHREMQLHPGHRGRFLGRVVKIAAIVIAPGQRRRRGPGSAHIDRLPEPVGVRSPPPMTSGSGARRYTSREQCSIHDADTLDPSPQGHYRPVRRCRAANRAWNYVLLVIAGHGARMIPHHSGRPVNMDDAAQNDPRPLSLVLSWVDALLASSNGSSTARRWASGSRVFPRLRRRRCTSLGSSRMPRRRDNKGNLALVAAIDRLLYLRLRRGGCCTLRNSNPVPNRF